jgi:hypothetical protein
MRKVLFLLILGLVAALPSLAMADSNWTGAISADPQNPANWNNGIPHNEYYTEIAGINITDWGARLPSPTPLFDSSLNVIWDTLQVYGLDVTMTGGSLGLWNGTSHQGLALCGLDWSNAGVAADYYGWDAETVDMLENEWGNIAGTLTMTGGAITTDRVGLGHGIWDPQIAPGTPIGWWMDGANAMHGQGIGILTLAGDSVLTIQNAWWDETGTVHYLWIHDYSYVDIREDGELRVPVDMTADIDTYIADGKILNTAGYAIVTETIGDEYVVSTVPEPGTLLLLCLGLGSLALIRRK